VGHGGCLIESNVGFIVVFAGAMGIEGLGIFKLLDGED
jgi:hypothetical protein